MYDSIISDAAFLYGVPESWIRAFITVESSWNPDAVSSLGAIGLMQIMPSTAAGLGVTDSQTLFDPVVNIDTGARLLQELIGRFGQIIEPVASAYYSGSGTAYQTNQEVSAYVDKIKAALSTVAVVGGSGLILVIFVWLLFLAKKGK